MKSLFASILLITIWLESYSQENKRGNIWVLGYVPAVTFDFNASMQVDTFANLGGTKVSSAIADTNGNLQFYSNGFGIVTSAGNLMENGSKVNCPFGQVLHDYYGGGSIFAQTSIILPRKGKTYYVFCTGMSDSVANNYLNHVYTEFDVLNYSVVDMDSNGGLGKVVQKNIVLADKQHYTNCAMQAVKHANGKDWWLVKADCRNNRYQEFLVTADTILGPFYQNCTVVGDICDYWGSQVIFDSAGATMACSMYGSIYGSAPNLFSYWNRTEIYDFDRCDGSIFHRKTYYAPYDTSSYPDYDFKVGICFSPNGKLLYMSTKYSIFQIDVEDTSQNNAILINGPDTTLANFPYYSLMGSAPDGKLYIGNWNALRKYMSFIDSPNVRGLGCAFRPQGLWQPYTNLKSPPNMPNYGLGPDTSKPCWPLNLSESGEREANWVVYPNPAQTQLSIESEAFKKGLNYLRIFNLMGQCVLEEEFKTVSGKHTVSVRGLPAGLYVLRVNGGVRRVLKE